MAESNRDKAARGGWGLGAAAGVINPPRAIDGVRGGTYPGPDDIMPGARREIVMGSGEVPTATWNGVPVPVPFASVDTARTSTPANPQPAARGASGVGAALHAWAETLYSGDTVADVAAVHAGLLRYEACRGSRREPSFAALDVGVPESARMMYERERAAVRVEAVTPRDEPARPTGGASLNGWQTAAHFWERWSQ